MSFTTTGSAPTTELLGADTVHAELACGESRAASNGDEQCEGCDNVGVGQLGAGGSLLSSNLGVRAYSGLPSLARGALGRWPHSGFGAEGYGQPSSPEGPQRKLTESRASSALPRY